MSKHHHEQHDCDHSHDHKHHHNHLPGDGTIGSAFIWGLIFTASFVIVEFVAGFVFNSLALISDASHNLSDALALGISWIAILIAGRTRNNAKTFGYRRATILAALFNSVSLILISIYIFYEAIQRLINPPEIEGWAIVGVASVALLVNLAVARLLHNWSHGDLNARSAFLHVVTDAAVSVGVIIAGILQLLTGWNRIDPLVSLAIGLFIVWSAWDVTKEVVDVLLESTPHHLNMPALLKDMHGQPGVQNVHDLHVWTISSDFVALSCHLQLDDDYTLNEANKTILAMNQMLETKYSIHHATLQVECTGCNPLYNCDDNKLSV